MWFLRTSLSADVSCFILMKHDNKHIYSDEKNNVAGNVFWSGTISLFLGTKFSIPSIFQVQQPAVFIFLL